MSDKLIPCPEELTAAVLSVLSELRYATTTYGPFCSAHEGHSVIEEEYDELRKHVFTKHGKRDVQAMRAEAVQLAAMALRFIVDVCSSEEKGQR